jgi:ATP phosphoribosyltransferase
VSKIKVVLPKGRLYRQVIDLLNLAGYGIAEDDRQYMPQARDSEISVKIMKPQNIPQLLEMGSHDIGFAGYDWVLETGARVEAVLDLGFDPVRLVSAVPRESLETLWNGRKLVVASEYQNIATRYLVEKGVPYHLLRTFGATEVFPPDDADMIVDNSASGTTLQRHNMVVVDEILASTTWMLVSPRVLGDPWKKEKLGEMITLLKGVLDARDRVMLEMNVPESSLDAIVACLPCMRAPTVAPLYNGSGYAVKAAVRCSEAFRLIPRLKRMGAQDILETRILKVVV